MDVDADVPPLVAPNGWLVLPTRMTKTSETCVPGSLITRMISVTGAGVGDVGVVVVVVVVVDVVPPIGKITSDLVTELFWRPIVAVWNVRLEPVPETPVRVRIRLPALGLPRPVTRS